MAASLSGVFNVQEFTDLGAFGVGYRLYTYTASTTTHKAAFTTAAADVEHTYTSDGSGGQYIAINARGELPAPLFLASGAYDIALKTAAGATVWTRRAQGNNDASAELATSLASAATLSTGAGLVGFDASKSYAAGTVGAKLRQFVSVTDAPYNATGDGVTDDTAALVAAFASGDPINLLGLTYAVSGELTIIGPVTSDGATLKFTSNVTSALELGASANVAGTLTVDVSTVAVTNGLLLDGATQCSDLTAQRADNIVVLGNNHALTTNGVMLDATVAGASNSAWVHYAKLRRLTVRNCGKGLVLQASMATLTLSYVNANVIDEINIVGCKRSIVMSAASGSEISSNFIQRYVVQYGFVSGSGPTNGIEMAGTCSSNVLSGFVYDWDHTQTVGPVVSLDASTKDNRVESSAFSWEVSDLGVRNLVSSAITPARSGAWVSPHGRGFNGTQDNALAHWAGCVGTVTGTAATTGTATCSLTAGALLNIQRENDATASVTFVAGTGVASYTIEFRSTTEVFDGLSVVGAYFEPGYLPSGLTVQIDVGAGYVTRADFDDVQASDVFCRLDSVGGTDVYADVIGIKFIVKGSDARVVKLRQVYANGAMPKTHLSRGGDRMLGDLLFSGNGVGPILVDTATGDIYRVKVTNGVLGLSAANPAKTMTYF